ncbi:uncharacterized protein LOC130719370 [Lotus japonicus]|uniref:uncharacterized protein LOC130719370 n=1 Tax=Lotus japonicus TaxID=34305 RepID=UPI00258349D6|nr:uncharacterized protein LOC130719370 [Lotus japonicus]
MEKGIRQGDPLAPFLFLVVAEGLNGIMKQAVLTKNFLPLCIGKNEKVDVSLLQFADKMMPKGVLKQCKQIMSLFLWGGSDEDRKVAWVNWEDLCNPKSAGGLGIRDLECFNLALLGKWRWGLMLEKDQLWCKVLYAKYGDGQAKKVSIWWADFLKSCVGSEANFWFENAVSRRIGEGDDTWFWREDWFGNGKFCDMFADLFQVSAQQELRVVEMGCWEVDKWLWNLQWSCRLDDGCVNQLSSLLNILSSFTPIRGQKDRCCSLAGQRSSAAVCGSWAIESKGWSVGDLAGSYMANLGGAKCKVV